MSDTENRIRSMNETIARFPSARIKFCGNILYCSSERDFLANLHTGMAALAMITGLSIEELSQSEQLTVEAYRSS